MLLFYREIQTTGDLPAIMPLIKEFVGIAKSVGVPLQVWAGSNGCVAGTLAISANYESLAARAEGTAKLMAAKGWWETGRKFREYVSFFSARHSSTAMFAVVLQVEKFQMAQLFSRIIFSSMQRGETS